jgi:hypothetical protein
LCAAPVSAIGELVVWEEEGGYCTPAISIKTDAGEVSLEEMVEKLIPGIKMGGGAKGVMIEVTMRLLSPNARGQAQPLTATVPDGKNV